MANNFLPNYRKKTDIDISNKIESAEDCARIVSQLPWIALSSFVGEIPDNIQYDTTESCVICFEDVKDRVGLGGCRHTFCGGCVLEWARHQTKCPLCDHSFHVMLFSFDQCASKFMCGAYVDSVLNVVGVKEQDMPQNAPPDAEDLACLDHTYFEGELQRMWRMASTAEANVLERSRRQGSASRWAKHDVEAQSAMLNECLSMLQAHSEEVNLWAPGTLDAAEMVQSLHHVSMMLEALSTGARPASGWDPVYFDSSNGEDHRSLCPPVGCVLEDPDEEYDCPYDDEFDSFYTDDQPSRVSRSGRNSGVGGGRSGGGRGSSMPTAGTGGDTGAEGGEMSSPARRQSGVRASGSAEKNQSARGDNGPGRRRKRKMAKQRNF
eukprot:Rmarinus@m.15329